MFSSREKIFQTLLVITFICVQSLSAVVLAEKYDNPSKPVVGSELDSLLEHWEDHWASPDSSDFAYQIKTASDNRVYVAGLSKKSEDDADFSLIAYSTSGRRIWSAIYDAPAGGWDEFKAMDIDEAGNIYLAGSSDRRPDYHSTKDFLTLKYSSQGELIWENRLEGAIGNINEPRAILASADSCVYVTGGGTIVEGENFSNYLTVKYSSDGEEEWVVEYDGESGQNDIATDIAFDPRGNIVITGVSVTMFSVDDYLTLKYNPSGELLWASHFYDFITFDNDNITLAVDSIGNAYISGFISDDYPWSTMSVAKLDSSGDHLWTMSYPDSGDGTDHYAVDMGIDEHGNVFVTGKGWDENENSWDIVTAHYSTDGQFRWASTFDGDLGSDNDVPVDMIVKENGTVYIAGQTGSSLWHQNYISLEYDRVGNEEMAVLYNGPGHGIDFVQGIDLDDDGSLYVTGFTYPSIYDSVVVHSTIKYGRRTLSIPEGDFVQPVDYTLFDIYPNPFNSTLKIHYKLENPAFVSINIYDLLGRKIETLLSKSEIAGEHNLIWDAHHSGSGSYYLEINADGKTLHKRAILVR
ncbi:MAG: T9SS type A sorting domain-containing protein [Candidatus Electryonea clarkiae]|nr:T9SS type A sorting domain-containing protein [Candidatus Electryonea clarkiae]MDP8286328.1 T9SS type A sorting domain-containing protein [Candidatus Electryonea clarkiae]